MREGRRWIAGIAACAVLLGAAAGAAETRTLLEQQESLYNNIYVYQDGPYVSMTFGHNRAIYTESVYNTSDDRELPVAYTRFMTASLGYAKRLDSILEIGFGGGRTASYLHRFLPDVRITSVELDPVVVALARKYFGVREEPNFRVVSQDGRIFLSQTSERYDVILIDAYRGAFVPFHLTTKEFYLLVKSRLAEGGVVAENVEPSTLLFDAVAKTVNVVFPQLDLYLAEGNMVTIAYDGAARDAGDLARVSSERQAAFRLRYDLGAMLAQRQRYSPRIVVDGPQPTVLTDDFAPVEALKAIEVHNRKWPDR